MINIICGTTPTLAKKQAKSQTPGPTSVTWSRTVRARRAAQPPLSWRPAARALIGRCLGPGAAIRFAHSTLAVPPCCQGRMLGFHDAVRAVRSERPSALTATRLVAIEGDGEGVDAVACVFVESAAEFGLKPEPAAAVVGV